MKNAVRLAGRCSLLVIGLTTISTAHAQHLADAPSQADAERAALSSGDIVVTARRREETLQDVPVSVTAMGREQLERYDLTSLERVAATTPDLQIARVNTGSGAQLTIRGVGSSFNSIGIEQSVAVVVDGTYYGQGRIINEGFFDMERLEVLKGPQAMLYGKNATAGVISITTASPGNKPEVIVKAGYEFRARQVYGEAVYSSPITDTLGVRVALRGSKMYGGYFKNRADAPATVIIEDTANVDAAGGVFAGPTYNLSGPASHSRFPGEEALLGRLTVQWKPSDGLTNSFKVSGTINKDNSPSGNVVPSCINPGQTIYQRTVATPCIGEKFATYQYDLPEEYAASGARGWRKDGEMFSKYKSIGFNNELVYELDEVQLTNITNYNWNKFTGVMDNAFAADASLGGSREYTTEDTSYKAFSNEARVITSFDGPVNLMGGLYYQKTKRNYYQQPTFGFAGRNNADSTVPLHQRYLAFEKLATQKGETIAGYGQVNWKIVPQVELSAGVRYTHETKDSEVQFSYLNNWFSQLVPAFAVEGVPVRYKQTFNNWSPDVTLRYQPTDDITIYGGYHTGFKSGGYSISANISALMVSNPETAAFNPERVKGFEGGIKTTLADRQLRLNFGAYRYTYRDLQFEFFDAVELGQKTVTGNAKIIGFEMSANFEPHAVPGLSLRATANYNKSTYTSFLGPCYTGQTAAAGCTETSPLFNGGAQERAGATLPNAPRWVGSAGISYETNMSDGLKLLLNADARYSDDYNLSFFGTPAYQQSYVNLDATIGLRHENGMEISLIGKNLTNRFIRTSTNDLPNTGALGLADQMVTVSPPRTIALQLTYRY